MKTWVRRHAWSLAVVAAVLLAVGLRAAYATRNADRLMGDGAMYHRLAVQLLEEGYIGYSSATFRSWRPPLYPAWLAGVYAVAGTRPLAGKIADSLLAGLVTLGIAWLGRRLGRPGAGLVGALLYATYAYEIRHATDLYPETLISLLVLAFVHLEVGRQADRPVRSLLHGVLAGVLLHLQPALATIPILAAVRRFSSGRSRILPGVLLLGGVVAALVPWTVRNADLHGGFVFVTTNGGFNLLRGHNDHADGDRLTPEGAEYVTGILASAPPDLTEPQLDRWLRGRALAWMREHPGETAYLVAARLRYWLLPRNLIEPGSHWPITYGLVFPFAVVGVFSFWRRRTPLAPLLLTILAGGLPSVLVVYAGQRYRSPVLAILILLAGAGIVATVAFLRKRLRPRDSGAP